MQSIYIPLPRGGAIWLERTKQSGPFEVVEEAGEKLVWFKSLFLIFTPPGWKPKPAKARVRRAFSAGQQRVTSRTTKAVRTG
jgi:hypothetical protein